MSTLFDFLEHFELSTMVHILYEDGTEVLAECEVGDVPQRVSNKCTVVKERVRFMGSVMQVVVKKH